MHRLWPLEMPLFGAPQPTLLLQPGICGLGPTRTREAPHRLHLRPARLDEVGSTHAASSLLHCSHPRRLPLNSFRAPRWAAKVLGVLYRRAHSAGRRSKRLGSAPNHYPLSELWAEPHIWGSGPRLLRSHFVGTHTEPQNDTRRPLAFQTLPRVSSSSPEAQVVRSRACCAPRHPPGSQTSTSTDDTLASQSCRSHETMAFRR